MKLSGGGKCSILWLICTLLFTACGGGEGGSDYLHRVIGVTGGIIIPEINFLGKIGGHGKRGWMNRNNLLTVATRNGHKTEEIGAMLKADEKLRGSVHLAPSFQRR